MSYTPLPIQVLVMSYTTFRIHQKLVYSKGIDMLIVDEAHSLKNGKAQATVSLCGGVGIDMLIVGEAHSLKNGKAQATVMTAEGTSGRIPSPSGVPCPPAAHLPPPLPW